MKRLPLLLLAVCLLTVAQPAQALERSQAFVMAALKIAGVKSKRTQQIYARAMRSAARKHNFDPITMVALLEGESHYQTRVVNSLGCVGLGQVCVKFIYAFCKTGNAAYSKAKCDAKKVQLMNPIVNINFVAGSISANRKFCNNLTNKTSRRTRSQWRHWFPSHGGYNKGNLRKKTGVWCGQRYTCTRRRRGRCVKKGWVNVPIPKTIRKYMRRRRQLIRRVQRR